MPRARGAVAVSGSGGDGNAGRVAAAVHQPPPLLIQFDLKQFEKGVRV